MKRNQVLNIGGVVLIILAILLLVLGMNAGPKILVPPIVTGIGFIVIASVFMMLKEHKG